MMAQNIWIVTIGSSDVQLKTNRFWNYWCPEIEHKFYGNTFEPTKTEQFIWGQDGEESERITYRLPARVLGLVYSALPDQVGKHLTFPLLDRFISQLKEEQVIPTTIVILLTDQEQFFSNSDKQRDFCPYWQDTCWLEEALIDCFFSNEDNGLKGVELEWIVLPAKNEEGKDGEKYGLDHWDKVLSLVTNELKEFKKVNKVELKSGDRVYVSHQAGTPAISSAVQFVCLAEFENQFQVEGKPPQQTVRFLVSNEYGSTAKPIKSSEYLRGIRKQEALALLKRHDYSGIKALIAHYLNHCEQILLDAAIQWNYAEFEKFSVLLKEQSISEKYSELAKKVEDRTEKKNWWWTAYEAAYLGVVRLNQGNTVEAFFHCFRAFEGLISNWSVIFYPNDIEDKNGKAVAVLKVSSKLPQYLLEELGELKKKARKTEIELYGERLFRLFRESNLDLKDNEDLKTIWKFTRNIRNQQFHRLKGLDKSSLYKAWGMNSRPSWEKRLLNCLQLISDQPNLKSLGEASLMVQVHQELLNAIADL